MEEKERFRVFVPLDGSKEAESVLPALMPLFRTRPAEVVLLGVSEGGWEEEAARAYLAEVRRKLMLEGIPPVSRVEQGAPADTILEVAREERADLIAMATHGRSGLRRIFLGSVTEQVLRRTPLPMIVARPETRVGDWKRIVVSLDGSAAAESVMSEAGRLARALEAKLTLFRSRVPAPGPVEFGPYAAYVPSEDPAPYLRELSSRLAGEGVASESVTRDGPPVEQLLEFASRSGAGLICITTHGRSGLSRVMLGSVAEEVIRRAPCAVLVRRIVPAREAVESEKARKP